MVTLSPDCPDCGAPLVPGQQSRCPQCRLPLTGHDAAALWQVTAGLHRLEGQRQELTYERDRLLGQLRARRDAPDAPPAPPVAPFAPPAAQMPPAPAPSGWAPPRREVSSLSAQTVLLVLGGLLVTVAALVFTVVSWGSLGLGGRTAVLCALTACALALPRPLRRRGLGATAEASGAIGLGLVLLDCYAARAAGLAGLDSTDGTRYWAAVTALLSVGALGYGWAVRLRFPLAAGFLLTRLPVPLLLAAAGVRQPQAYATAFVAGAALDCALLWCVQRAGSPARLGGPALFRAATVLATVWAVLGGALAAFGSLTTHRLTDATWAWLPFSLLALLGLVVSARYRNAPAVAQPPAAGAAVALLLAAGGTLRTVFTPAWAAVAYELPGVLLLAVGLVLLRRAGGRRPAPVVGVSVTAGVAVGGTSIAAVPGIAVALLQPFGQASEVWVNPPASAWTWQVAPAALTGLGLLVAVLAAVTALRVIPAPSAELPVVTALVALPVLALLPVAVGLPYPVALATAVLLAAVAGTAVLLDRARPVAPAALVGAVALALAWACADRAATITVLALAAGLGVLLIRRGRCAPVAAAATVLALGAEAAAIGTTAGLARPDTLLAVLAVAIATAPVAARAPRTIAPVIEATGYVLAALAMLLTVDQPGRLSFALAVTGVAAFGVALRADRRPAAAYAGTALLIASSWIRLALSQVHTPEAYSLTVAAAALAIGGLRRRRDPSATSWAAYGPGLSAGLLPSVLALWTDGHWLRPLLLGSAALAVTVLGVRFRLQAPLLLGGGALLLTALHELAPRVMQLIGLLPRWVPLALAGLLLLVLGARFEQRLRDARRLRDRLRQFQ